MIKKTEKTKIIVSMHDLINRTNRIIANVRALKQLLVSVP